MEYAIRKKAGRLANGWEADKGTVYHAKPCGSFAALCGTTPGMDWAYEEGDAVTCPRCLKKLAKLEGTA
jgi:hypothetical protein